MRITNKLLTENFLHDVNRNQVRHSNLQNQVTSGKRIHLPSDDPLAVGRSLIWRNTLRLNERHLENIAQATTLLNSAEDNLATVQDVMNRARELAIKAANNAFTAPQYEAVAREIEQLLDQVVLMGNYSNGEQYIWGGHQTRREPFVVEKDMVVNGSSPAPASVLGFDKGTNRATVQWIGNAPVQGGVFSIPSGGLVINGVDLGSVRYTDPARTASDNALALVDLINAKTEETGVSARVLAVPADTVVLESLDENGNPSGREIRISGTDNGRVTTLKNSKTGTHDVQAWGAAPVTFPPGGDITAGSFLINGVDIGLVDLTTGPPANAEEVAQRIAKAINAVSNQTGVRGGTNGGGTLVLSGISGPFTLALDSAGNANVANISTNATTTVAGTTTTTTFSHFLGAAVSAASMTFGEGSLTINGVEVFPQAITINTGTALDNARSLAVEINKRSNDTGVRATATANGELAFSIDGSVITNVRYRGDAGRRDAEIGVNNTVSTGMSGDEAFTATYETTTLVGVSAVPIGPTLPAPNVTLNPGDLVINGVDIFNPPLTLVSAAVPLTADQVFDQLATAINNQSNLTGVVASRDATSPPGSPRIVLTTQGRDIQISGNEANRLATTGLLNGTTKSENTIFDTLIRFREQLMNAKSLPGRVENISIDILHGISEAMNMLADHRSVLGARVNRMEVTEERTESLNLTVKTLLSEAEDTDFAETLARLSASETLLQASMAAGARLLPPSLLDFLR